MRGFTGYIHITNHAKERFIERRLNVISNNRNINVYKKMIGMIKRSTLVKYLRKEDGRIHEYREYAGCIFVCHREISRDPFKQDFVTVITVEITDGAITAALKKGYSVNSLSLNTYTLNKVNGILN